MKWFLICMRKYADVNGRARRKEYWMFTLFTLIAYLNATILDTVAHSHFYLGGRRSGVVYALVEVGLLLPSFTVQVRRLHDIGKNSTLAIIFYTVYLLHRALTLFYPVTSGFDPFSITKKITLAAFMVLAIWLLVLDCREGDKFENRFGPDPKGAGDNFDFDSGVMADSHRVE